MDYHLKPLVQNFPSFIKDTTHFLLQLQKLGPLTDNALLVTLDVSSLYTNIPHNKGIDACHYFLNTHQDKLLPAENICDLTRMILTMNNVSFNNEHYLQKHGTAMGTWMAPSLTTTSKQISIQSPQTNINTYSKHRATQTTPKKPSHSASSSESAVYVLLKLSLTNEAENSLSTLPNVVITAPHYKEMRIVFAQFHVN